MEIVRSAQFRLTLFAAAVLLAVSAPVAAQSDTCSAGVSISATPGTSICQGALVTLRGVPVNGGAFPTYRWYVNGVLADNDSVYATAGLNNGDVVTLLLISSFQCTPAPSDTDTVTFTVTDVSASATPAAATCNTADGSITVSGVTGGSAPYTYSLNGAPAQGNATFSNLPAGQYTVIVFDTSGCSDTLSVTVPITGSISNVGLSVTDAPCGTTNGSIAVTGITGGSGPYKLKLSNGDSTVTSTFPVSFTGLAPGAYSLSVFDAAGCEFLIDGIVVDIANEITTVPVNTTPESCSGTDGTLIIDQPGISGGQAPYLFSLDGGSTFSAQTTYTGLPAGNYTILVRDVNNCLFATGVTLANNCTYNTSALFVFNSFTPNGDGTNDTWVLSGIETYSESKVQVYNRWGQRVYSKENYTNAEGWDGSSATGPLPEATYFYVVEATGFDGTEEKKSGTVTIIR